MGVPYDIFANSFLSKVTEFDYLQIDREYAIDIIDGFMKRALQAFRKNCKYDFFTTADDAGRVFDLDVPADDLEEIVNIVSDGMIAQWMKPYLNKTSLLRNVLNTRDFTVYSPAELLMRVGNAYEKAQKEFIQGIREYSFNHGKLTELHI